MFIFVWGAIIYFAETRPPRNAMEVYAVGKQWMWKFQHQEGQREINVLHVPVDRDVRMIMTSQDVIHSFFVPAFRIKADVLPGRYTSTWFHATVPGTYHLFCSQYCGTQHSGMVGEVVVMDPAAYQQWAASGSDGSLAQQGEEAFQQYGCSMCHRADYQGRGPNLVDLFGKPVLLDDGRTVIADESYIRESIIFPGAKVVSGFKNIMPNFQGQISEEELIALVAYIKGLGTGRIESAGHRGRTHWSLSGGAATREIAGNPQRKVTRHFAAGHGRRRAGVDDTWQPPYNPSKRPIT